MPPKKATANGKAGEGPFKWEGPNDTKLLLLTQGRYVKPDEYEQLAQAFPGATIGSIRNRISSLRVKQRDLYDSLNWTLRDGGAGHSAKKTAGKKNGTPRKRDAAAAAVGEADSDAALETPSKKNKKSRVCKANAETPETKDESCGSGHGSAEEEEKRVRVKEEGVGDM